MTKKQLKISNGVSPAEPLWKIAPTRDEDGNRVSDFMMIIPKLKHKPKHIIQNTLAEIEAALLQFKNSVVFANMDLKLNTLWVSVKPVPGICTEVSAAVKLRVPEAILVGDMSARIPG